MRNHPGRLLAVGLVMGLVAAACSDDGDQSASAGTTEAVEAVTTTTEAGGAGAECAAGVELKTPGQLTIGTEFPDFDRDTILFSVAEAVAAELGYAGADALFMELEFDDTISPGAKEFDIGMAAKTITAERDASVDFSDPYLPVDYVLVGPTGSPAEDAEFIADLRDDRVTSTFFEEDSFDYIEEVIVPTTPVAALPDGVPTLEDDAADALVYPNGYAAKLAEFGGLDLIALLPPPPVVEQLGLSFEEGSELRPCVNEALAALQADGTIDELVAEDQWLSQLEGLPTLSG